MLAVKHSKSFLQSAVTLHREPIKRSFQSTKSLQRGIVIHHDSHKWKPGQLTREQILKSPSTPVMSPSYPRGPYEFKNREYFIIGYETDVEAIRKVVPYPLQPKSNVVLYEWIKMPDSSGFGDYQESGTVIPCTYNGQDVSLTVQMFLDCEPPIACGREIWGFPKKYALPKLTVERDTLTGVLNYAGRTVAMGTMQYKHTKMDDAEVIKALQNTACNLKLIPGIDFKPATAQLVAYNLQIEKLHHAWQGPARLALSPHVNAPTADLPVRNVLWGKHIKADLVLPYGRVLYDYKTDSDEKHELLEGQPSAKKVLKASAMPMISPSYVGSPSKLANREYLIITYRSTPEAVRAAVPELLAPNPDNHVVVSWVRTEGSGFGSYNKVEVHIPCKNIQTGEMCAYSVLSFLDNSSPITAGREIYGQPQKFGHPSLYVDKDTICGTLKYGAQDVCMGSMVYNHKHMDMSDAFKILEIPEVNLKMIPDSQGNPEIAQLLQVKFDGIKIKSAWEGPARIHSIPHVNAPIADLPVVETIRGNHINVEELVLSPPTVVHDYLVNK